MERKGVIIVFFLVIFLSGIISAENCAIVERDSCTGENHIVMGVSAETDAHGEVADQNNYDYVLCCDLGTGNTTCNGENKIIGLENTTNSHAEVGAGITYTNDICYENLDCINKMACNSLEMGILSLSDLIDAHIGRAGDYSIKICCSGMCEEGEEYVENQCTIAQAAYWADSDGNHITHQDVLVENTQIILVLSNSRLSQGTEVTFKIYEQDPLLPDLIRSLNGIVDDNETANIIWTVTQADLDATGETDFDGFYFEVNGESSNLLSLTLVNVSSCGFATLCGDYKFQQECESDICNVGEFSIESKDSEISCDEIETDSEGCQIWASCGCSWMDNTCISKKTENIQPDCEPEGNPSEIGSCFYGESTTDDCEDGFLSYSWESAWSWGIDNIFDNNPGSEGTYILGNDSKWHYDPNLRSDSCTGGSKTVPCPVQIRLPFFGIFNIVSVMILVGLIYYLIKRERD